MKLAQRRIQRNELIYKFISFNSICLLNTYRKIWTSILSKIWRYRWCCISLWRIIICMSIKKDRTTFFPFFRKESRKVIGESKKKKKKKQTKHWNIEFHWSAQGCPTFGIEFPSPLPLLRDYKSAIPIIPWLKMPNEQQRTRAYPAKTTRCPAWKSNGSPELSGGRSWPRIRSWNTRQTGHRKREITLRLLSYRQPLERDTL